MHKSSGKHMPDSSDEFKLSNSDLTSDSDSERAKRRREQDGGNDDNDDDNDNEEKKQKALSDLISKTAVVPLTKLPDSVTNSVNLKSDDIEALGELHLCIYSSIHLIPSSYHMS